jgi:hypothetical protein
VQLEQAIFEVKTDHRRLPDLAALVRAQPREDRSGAPDDRPRGARRPHPTGFQDVLDHDVPTFAEVEEQIRQREAIAQARGELAELQRPQVDRAVLEIEAPQRSADAHALLGQLRSQLGLPVPLEERRMLGR